MKTISNSLNLHSSAFVPNHSQSGWKELRAAIANFASRTIAFLSGEGYNSPKIYAKRDRSGRIYYRVVDPMTRTSQRFDCEYDVMVWLESRY